MTPDNRSFPERWQSTVTNVRSSADRLQASADALPPEATVTTAEGLHKLYSRHIAALADHSVALNCLNRLIAERCGGDS